MLFIKKVIYLPKLTAAAGSMETFGFFGLVGAKDVDKDEEDDEGIAFVTLGNETDAPEVTGTGEVGIRLVAPLLLLWLLLLPLDSL